MLSAAPVMAGATHSIVGEVIQSTSAYVNSAPIPYEWTITGGDIVSTGSDGNALVSLPKEVSASLFQNTKVLFERVLGRLVAQLSEGSIRAQTSGKDTLAVEASGYTVEPAKPSVSVYWVSMQPDKIVISSRRGSIQVVENQSGDLHMVPEGHYATISQPRSPRPASPEASLRGSQSTKKDKPSIVILAGQGTIASGLTVPTRIGIGPPGPTLP